MKKPVVTITTATKLTATQKKHVREELEQKMGAVTIEEVIDPTVIGGLKITIGNQEFDATVAGKLEKLESHLPVVSVITAIELTAAQRQKIKDSVESKLGPVTITEVVDPSIIGGIRIVAGSKEVDATVKGRLDRLKQQLLHTL
jgi:F0F1-type ATP synthase delta subunit